MRSSTLALALPALVLVGSAVAETVTFELIPDAASADDMSPDGRFIVGSADQNGDGFPDGTYRLDTVKGEMLILPSIGRDAVAVSDDGQVVLGSIPDPEGVGDKVAAIWTEAGGWESIGHLPSAGGCPSRSTGYELSADGSVAVGLSWDGCNALAMIWTRETGMVAMEELANGSNRASVVSADGSVLAGFAQGSFSRTPARWEATGEGELLDPPDGDVIGEIHGISDDGALLLGEWDGDAIMWTEGDGPMVIGAGQMIPGWIGIPMDVADNGTIVGFDFLVGNRRAWIQPRGEDGLVELKGYVETHGGTIPDGLRVEVCQAVTTNGRKIIGHGFLTGAWIVNIMPCDGDVDGDEMVDFGDILAILAAWGPCDDCDADLDDSGVVDFADVLIVLANWGACP